MYSAARENKKGRFRRVSKARIFDGHPLKISIYAVTVMVAAYTCITAVISLLFFYFHTADFILVPWTLLPGGLLGLVFLVMERWLRKLKEYMLPEMGNFLTAFLLFFFHVIGYLAFSSIIFSYPLGQAMETFRNMDGIAGEYSLFAANFFIVFGVVSWLRNVKTQPYRCL